MWDRVCDSYSVECSHYGLQWCGAVYFGRYKSQVVPAHTMKECKGIGVEIGTGRM